VSKKASGNDAVGREFEVEQTLLRRVQMTLHRYPWLSSLVVLVAVLISFGAVKRAVPPALHHFVDGSADRDRGSLAIAQALIILTAGIDLSIGSIMIFGQMLMANLAVFVVASNVFAYCWTKPVLGSFLRDLGGHSSRRD